MFATTDINTGDLIVCERPLLVYPSVIPGFLGATRQEVIEPLRVLVQSMKPEMRADFYALHNCKGPEEPSRIVGITNTNSVWLGKLPGFDEEEFCGVCKDISRANHSCSPNALYRWVLESFTFELRARLPIRNGEQITISYKEELDMRASRQAELQLKYHFKCTCRSCSLSGAASKESDQRRLYIARANGLSEQFDAELEMWARSPDMADDDALIRGIGCIWRHATWNRRITRICGSAMLSGRARPAAHWEMRKARSIGRGGSEGLLVEGKDEGKSKGEG
ncbi:Histone-lysine N-methyltransferase SMYD1 [Grifola frondosa]|uniref:Histone-lysine N-methyltransferase SMYD1 n=1 Tax=Grifola frondosa TaxID=5627 RepID=A0A1C7M8A3_GRIFR|nr:Histone-lysine N-methyltransferase SMYD1 [Grifola frondosa]